MENAVLHGIQNRESKGRVGVLFSRKGDNLEVTVTDNGTGFSLGEKDAGQSANAHKSVGMMLTQKRLDLLAGATPLHQQSLLHETIYNEEGVVCGTCMRILIPIVEG